MEGQNNDELLKNTLKKFDDMGSEKIGTLLKIWMDIGFEENVIEKRLCTVNTHIEDLLNEMLTEAETERAQIADQVNVLLKKIFALRKRLRIAGPMLGYEDVPFIQIIPQLESKIKEYEEQIENYLTNLKQLMRDEARLCASLGKKTKEICLNPLPLQSEIEDFENYVENLRQLQFEREEEFVQLKMDIIQFLKDLNEKPTLNFHREVLGEDKSFPVTDENMERLKEWHTTLRAEVEQNKAIAAELREKLTALWELLEECTIHRTNFASEVTGFSNGAIAKLNTEIQRCEEQKRANIKVFVDKLRTEIVHWWDKCQFGPSQRDEFILFKSDNYNEDLLKLHELQLEKLRKHYENHAKIYTLLQKRDELWKKCIYLAEKANCPSRFKNRGGELLREEKERREVGLKLPEIERQLLDEVHSYEQQNGHPFLINDMNVSDIIEEDRNQFKETQNAKLSAKKKARDNTAATPSMIGKSLLRPTTPNVQLTNAGVKRKLLACTPQSTAPKRNKPITTPTQLPRTVPKLKVNNRTIKLSTSIRRKLNPKRRSKDGISPSIRARNPQTPVIKKEYEKFKEGVSARSSLFVPAGTEQKENRPRTPKKTVTVTSRSPKTPRDGTKLRAVSPLPIIF